jgi:hypothetical protein
MDIPLDFFLIIASIAVAIARILAQHRVGSAQNGAGAAFLTAKQLFKEP